MASPGVGVWDLNDSQLDLDSVYSHFCSLQAFSCADPIEAQRPFWFILSPRVSSQNPLGVPQSSQIFSSLVLWKEVDRQGEEKTEESLRSLELTQT